MYETFGFKRNKTMCVKLKNSVVITDNRRDVKAYGQDWGSGMLKLTGEIGGQVC